MVKTTKVRRADGRENRVPKVAGAFTRKPSRGRVSAGINRLNAGAWEKPSFDRGLNVPGHESSVPPAVTCSNKKTGRVTSFL